MSNIKKLNSYDIKDAEARGDIASLTNELNNEETGIVAQIDEINDDISSINNSLEEIRGQISNFNLTIFEDIDNSDITSSEGTIDTTLTSMKTAKNTDGSLAKIYGRVRTEFNSDTGTYHVSFPTSLRPEEAFSVSTCVYSRLFLTVNDEVKTSSFITSLTVGTNGVVTSGDINIYEDVTSGDFFFQPFLIFVSNFGDEPTPEEPEEPTVSEEIPE